MHDDSYYEILEEGLSKITISNSKFYGYAYLVRDLNEIELKLDFIRSLHPKASHHCYAWRLGAEEITHRINDDGEPSGTAGNPIFNQILSYKLTNILVVSTRYFGGKKLGASGLKKAYKESAEEALANCKRVEKFVTRQFLVKTNYHIYPSLERALAKLNINILKRELTELCTLYFEIRLSEIDAKIKNIRREIANLESDLDIKEISS